MRFFLTLFYDLSLFALMLIFFPKMLWQTVFQRKYRKSFLSRFRGKGPTPQSNQPVIWLHGVSVGESKALSTLTPHIRKTHPNAFILVSTVTETGQQEAARSIPSVDAFCYLPLDFSWIIRRFVKRLRPDLLILVEGDFWYNLLKEVKKGGGAVVLVNGKVSETSFKRYLLLKSFSQELFQNIDYFCVQGEKYLERFLNLGIDPDKITVIDNLKYDIPQPGGSIEDEKVWKEKFGILENDTVITLGSTHEGEEEGFLTIFRPLLSKYENLKLLLVPRHPERFQKVEKSIFNGGFSYIKYSRLAKRKGDEKIILVDEMGVLPNCYKISHLSIVGGSFINGIGGHDVFEPAKMGTPVLFGPYMHKQVDLARTLMQSGAGKQVSLEKLTPLLEKYLSSPSLFQEDGEKGKRLAQKVMGSAFRTWKQIEKYANK